MRLVDSGSLVFFGMPIAHKVLSCTPLYPILASLRTFLYFEVYRNKQRLLSSLTNHL